MSWVDAGAQDLRYAIRGLARDPLLAIFVVVTLALGIGANAALFEIVDRMFLHPPSGIADPTSVRRLFHQNCV